MIFYRVQMYDRKKYNKSLPVFFLFILSMLFLYMCYFLCCFMHILMSITRILKNPLHISALFKSLSSMCIVNMVLSYCMKKKNIFIVISYSGKCFKFLCLLCDMLQILNATWTRTLNSQETYTSTSVPFNYDNWCSE